MRKPEFQNISKIIKEHDFAAIKKLSFDVNSEETDFDKATIILDLEGEEEFSIVIEGKFLSVHVNGNMLFTIDDEYTSAWKTYVKSQFNRVYSNKNKIF